jgi:uncharacterized protein YlxP (DUF503 family)
VHVLVLRAELHLPQSRSLKAKRSVVKSALARIQQRDGVGAAEVDHLEVWQRAALGVTVVAGDPGHCEHVMDDVERLLWSLPDTEVLEMQRSWWEGA